MCQVRELMLLQQLMGFFDSLAAGPPQLRVLPHTPLLENTVFKKAIWSNAVSNLEVFATELHVESECSECQPFVIASMGAVIVLSFRWSPVASGRFIFCVCCCGLMMATIILIITLTRQNGDREGLKFEREIHSE